MSSFRNARPRRDHKERSQPLHRIRKHGLLEKKKDYKLRARDNHRKEDRLKLLTEKAAFRNPDEFYYAMIRSAGTKDGVTRKSRKYDDAIPIEQRSLEEKKLAETQDSRYVEMKAAVERGKIDKLGKDLHFMEAARGADRTHTIFVDDEEELEQFDAARWFGTPRELLSNTENRVRDSDLKDRTILLTKPGSFRKIRKEREKAYRELEQRVERRKKLDSVLGDINLEKKLLSKGKKQKVREKDPDTGAPALYKWTQKRAR